MSGWLNFGSGFTRHHRALGAVLAATLLTQGYHVIEHTVKLAQFIASGMQGTPGIAGMHFDGVLFHFSMNASVLLPPLAAFLYAGVYRRLDWPPPS